MKELKRRMESFAFYDRTAIESHLEDMAQLGWMVEQPGNYLWRYYSIQPKRLHFSVTYFPNASDFDPSPTDGQRQMEEYCAKDGWIPAARWGQMQIFYNEGENPTPIETDAVTQVETIHRTMHRNMLPTHLFLLALCFYQFIFLGWQLISDPVDFLSNPYSLYMLAVWPLLVLSALWEVYFYFRWYRRAKAAAENGVFLEIKTHRRASILLLTISMLILVLTFAGSAAGRWSILLWLGIVILIIFAVKTVKAGMKKKGVSRGTNRTVSMAVSVVLTIAVMAGLTVAIIRYDFMDTRTSVGSYEHYGMTRKVYADTIPLRIEDLEEAAAVSWSTEQRRDETFLLSNTEYIQWPLTENNSIPDLEYTVTEIKAPILYELCKRALTRSEDEVVDGEVVLQDHYEPVDAMPWGAQEAYRLYWSDGYLNKYLLCFENRIIEIHFDWKPTPHQMAVVAEKLSGEYGREVVRAKLA